MRISRHQMFMKIAHCLAERSTCHRLNVGTLIVANRQPISWGYNGPPSGEPHCFGNDCPLSESGGCTRSDHAEANAINRLVVPDFITQMTLYTTHSPCFDCTQLILKTHGIRRIFYGVEYRDQKPIDLLVKGHREVFSLSPSGYLENKCTGEIIDAAGP